jgi:hypothetical protein
MILNRFDDCNDDNSKHLIVMILKTYLLILTAHVILENYSYICHKELFNLYEPETGKVFIKITLLLRASHQLNQLVEC